MSRLSGKQAAERKGRTAETIAAVLLMLKGYRIIARRVQTPAGEIDLIVKRCQTVVFVEVKARDEVHAALDAFTPRQQARIARAAEGWTARNTACAAYDKRIDMIAITPWRWPVHIANAVGVKHP